MQNDTIINQSRVYTVFKSHLHQISSISLVFTASQHRLISCKEVGGEAGRTHAPPNNFEANSATSKALIESIVVYWFMNNGPQRRLLPTALMMKCTASHWLNHFKDPLLPRNLCSLGFISGVANCCQIPANQISVFPIEAGQLPKYGAASVLLSPSSSKAYVYFEFR